MQLTGLDGGRRSEPTGEEAVSAPRAAYGQELTSRHSPQAGFLIRYMGQP